MAGLRQRQSPSSGDPKGKKKTRKGAVNVDIDGVLSDIDTAMKDAENERERERRRREEAQRTSCCGGPCCGG